MKLQKFKVRNNKKFVFIFISVIFLFLLGGIYLCKTYAVFSEEKHFNVINGEVQDPGDVYFAYYVNDEITRELPKQNTGYTLDTQKSNCTNGVKVNWDNKNWTALVNYQEYNATDYTRTRCNLYFKKTAVLNILNLAKNDTTNLALDDYGNTRYIGANPNNYVSIDGELWRIIGVMKDIDDGTGIKEDRIKLIRNESIGMYSWDSSDSSINSGYGVNEWSQAKLMKLLNPGYESESVGGSLYWNSKSGNCFTSLNFGNSSCDFTDNGLSTKEKNLMDTVLWNIGALGSNDSDRITNASYMQERGTNPGNICTAGEYCNDTIKRTTTWKGLVGLMYPSDYGYATSGGITISRIECLSKSLYLWNDSSSSDCKGNNWLFNQNHYWTMTPSANSLYAHGMIVINGSDGNIVVYGTNGKSNIYPVVYLSSNVLFSSGNGSIDNPFIPSL